MTGAVTFTVGELCEAIRLAFDVSFPEEVWVRGQIADLKRPKSGHVYFTLVEPGELGRAARAALPVALLADRKYVVNQILRRAGGGVRMADGTEIRLRGRLSFYPPNGRVSLLMTLIDPAYTLGRLAADRDRLLRALAGEGLLRRQAGLPLALAPLRIGLVTSAGSAAEVDFLHELSVSSFGFDVRTFHAQVQGAGAVESVVRALRAAQRHGCDLVAVVRGGGARTDLATFDAEDVARGIATLEVPVWTGIGHEVDRSVADEVAQRSFKTPTACARALVEAVADFVAALDARWAAVRARAGTSLERADAALGTRAAMIGRDVRGGLRRAEDGLGVRSRRLRQASASTLRSAEARVDVLDARVTAADPARALARGWSITRRTDGRLVRSPADAGPGAVLVTTVMGGEIRSTVDGTAGGTAGGERGDG